MVKVGNFYQLHKTRVGGVPIEMLHGIGGVGSQIHFFTDLEFPELRCLARKIWSGAVFLDLELLGVVPNTP